MILEIVVEGVGDGCAAEEIEIGVATGGSLCGAGPPSSSGAGSEE